MRLKKWADHIVKEIRKNRLIAGKGVKIDLLQSGTVIRAKQYTINTHTLLEGDITLELASKTTYNIKLEPVTHNDEYRYVLDDYVDLSDETLPQGDGEYRYYVYVKIVACDEIHGFEYKEEFTSSDFPDETSYPIALLQWKKEDGKYVAFDFCNISHISITQHTADFMGGSCL